MATLEEHCKRATKVKAKKVQGNKDLDKNSRRGQTEKMHPLMDASAKRKGGKGGDCY